MKTNESGKSRFFASSSLSFYFKTKSGVNFINIQRAAFSYEDPESTKNTVKPSVFFPLLGSASVKDASSTLMKLTFGVNPKTRRSIFFSSLKETADLVFTP